MEAGSLAYQAFKRRVREAIGIDLSAYKDRQMERRVLQWMERHRIPTLLRLASRMEEDAELREAFIDYLAINTSQFYRDPAVFEALGRQVLPELLERFGRLRIWSAGCSIGAEAYTVAMLLAELGQPPSAHNLLGTDIDEGALVQARAARYRSGHLSTLPAALAQRYLQPVEGGWAVRPEIARAVRFRRHDLLQDAFASGWHLVLCRYVFIYLTQPVQQRLVEEFARVLAPGGYLVVGAPEYLARPEAAGFERAGHCLYRKHRGQGQEVGVESGKP